MTTTGLLLRQARVRAGMTQADAARIAGTSQPVISAYEHSRRDPTVSTLRRLLAATGSHLELRAVTPEPSDLPAAASPAESGRRLVNVLLLADAIPRRPAGPLRAPRMCSVR